MLYLINGDKTEDRIMPVVMNTHTTALLELVVNMGTVATRDGGHTLHIQQEYIIYRQCPHPRRHQTRTCIRLPPLQRHLSH